MKMMNRKRQNQLLQAHSDTKNSTEIDAAEKIIPIL